MKYEKLIGTKLWYLTFIKEVAPAIDSYGRKARKFLCKCDCGNEVIVHGKAVIKGNTKSCGCYRKKVCINNVVPYRPKPNILSWEERLFIKHKQNCKSRKIENLLINNEFINLIQKDCFYCGDSPMNLYKDIREGSFTHKSYQGIDRLDSNRGYSLDNCVPCCKHCNWAKHNQNIKVFYEQIVKIYNKLKERRSV